jgi:hypothetical protein
MRKFVSFLGLTLSLLLTSCTVDRGFSVKGPSPSAQSLGVLESNYIYNEVVKIFVCKNNDGRTEDCRKVGDVSGVDGFQVPFNPETETSLKFRVPIEPSWQGTVEIQRGSSEDSRLLRKKMPYGRLQEKEKAFVDLDFVPCMSSEEQGSCLDYREFSNLVDYSGTFRVLTTNGKVSPRAAVFLVMFSEKDDHVAAEIRLFDSNSDELVNGSTRTRRCNWFRCKSPSIKVLTTPRAVSTWTTREKDNEIYLVEAYRKLNTENHEVPENSGWFKLSYKDYVYNTYYLDDKGRIKNISIRRD